MTGSQVTNASRLQDGMDINWAIDDVLLYLRPLCQKKDITTACFT